LTRRLSLYTNIGIGYIVPTELCVCALKNQKVVDIMIHNITTFNFSSFVLGALKDPFNFSIISSALLNHS
jgi:hypothetical protein